MRGARAGNGGVNRWDRGFDGLKRIREASGNKRQELEGQGEEERSGTMEGAKAVVLRSGPREKVEELISAAQLKSSAANQRRPLASRTLRRSQENVWPHSGSHSGEAAAEQQRFSGHCVGWGEEFGGDR